MLRSALLLCLAFLAACGSSSSSTPSTTPAPDVAEPASGAPPVAEPAEPVADAPDAPAPVEPDPAQVKADLLAAEMAAFDQAKPVFEKHCASCHVKGNRGAKKSTLGHFDMTRYPFGGHHADDVTGSVRKALAIGGGKPTMPKKKPGSVSADELALIAAWADAFDARAGAANAP